MYIYIYRYMELQGEIICGQVAAVLVYCAIAGIGKPWTRRAEVCRLGFRDVGFGI